MTTSTQCDKVESGADVDNSIQNKRNYNETLTTIILNENSTKNK